MHKFNNIWEACTQGKPLVMNKEVRSCCASFRSEPTCIISKGMDFLQYLHVKGLFGHSDVVWTSISLELSKAPQPPLHNVFLFGQLAM